MSTHTFAKLDRAYVKSVLLGMQQAIENGALIQWEPVIRLCHKVITNASVAVEGDLTSARRSDESDVKRHTLALLMTGLKSGPAEIPIALRTLTWETLRPLTQDSDPTPDYEAAQYGSNMDPGTLSINTIRGEAMHRIIQYGLWVRRSFEKLADTSSATEGFGAMPELREVLDYHLNVSNESSLAIRAVYGQWVPWLLFLDNNWTRTNIDSIFPRDGSLADYRHVAWYTYIIYCPPYDEVFDILKQEYATATATIAAESIWKPAHINPDESLANHIMAFYWRGRLDLDRSGLCQDFFRRAPQKVAGYAIKFIGRSLKNTNEGISDRILDRLRDLWEQRLDIAKTDDVGLHFLELSAFGWWFTSGKFEQNWALRKLQEALEIAGDIDDDLHVVEELAKLSFSDPIRTIKCVNLLVKAPKEPGRIFAYQEAARRVIASAMTSDSKTARALAEATVQLLMAQGHLGFTDLLPSA